MAAGIGSTFRSNELVIRPPSVTILAGFGNATAAAFRALISPS
jgi:hypothetical protein